MKKILIVLGVIAVVLLAWYLFLGGGLERFKQKGADVVIAPQPTSGQQPSVEEILKELQENSQKNGTTAAAQPSPEEILKELQKSGSKNESGQTSVDEILKELQKSGTATK